jgi:DNA-binding LacI/PurR family transcriptional regulator
VPRTNGRTTIVDVARAAGTSVSSASVALRGEPGVSDQTRTHILETAARLGYQPDQRARLLREQRSRLLGVTFSVGQTFHTDVVEDLYRAADDAGFDLVLSATTGTRTGERAIESLLGDRCETMILVSPQISAGHLAQFSRRASLVLIGSELVVDGVDSVRSDDRRGVTEAVNHLAGLGHRAIAYVDGGDAVLSATRRTGYLEAMAARGLGDRARVIAGDASEEAGMQAATRLLDEGLEPTAILAHNDMVAFGVWLTLQTRGVAVPDEVSVIGYDDTRVAGLPGVRLTSVSQDAEQLARTAMECATTRFEDTSLAAREIVTPARLVVRDTSGRPRSQEGPDGR